MSKALTFVLPFRRRWQKLFQYLLLVVACYIALQFVVATVSSRSVSHAAFVFGVEAEYNRTRASSNQVHSRCQQVVQVAAVCLGPSQTAPFVAMFKTLLYHRQDEIHVHIVVNDFSKYILQTLFDTWQLPYVNVSYVPPAESVVKTKHEEDWTKLLLPFLIQRDVEKVIFIGNRVRFLEDVGKLWSRFDQFSDREAYGTPHSQTRTLGGDVSDVILYHLPRVRGAARTNGMDRTLLAQRNDDVTEWRGVLDSLVSPFERHKVQCHWSVSVSDAMNCLAGKPAKALVWDKNTDTFSGVTALEQQKEEIMQILASSGDLYRYKRPLRCAEAKSSDSPPPRDRTDPKEPCAGYRYSAHLKRRTHLYFMGGKLPVTSGDDDVTVMTQFTLDRFAAFERFMAHWTGPASVVLYLRDGEADRLTKKVTDSAILQKRPNIAYHVVFARDPYYPINYLRNVAVSQCHTPFLLFIDVDLIPNTALYADIRRSIRDIMIPKPEVTLVVPAFEAFEELTNFPSNKSELLTLLKEEKVGGYRMLQKWNLGHKPTNYNKWKTTSENYKVEWKDAFEPYVVLRSLDVPLYDERLLERMGDKIAYGRQIYAQGYEFLVLANDFIVHLPHPVSDGTKFWKSNANYFRCGASLFGEFRDELKAKYPNQKF